MAFWEKYLINILVGVLTVFSPTLALAELSDHELGRAQAEFVQGSRYFYGRGTEKDMDKALEWYMKSAERGHAKSELAVSQVLAYGDLKNPRYQEALPWLIKASSPHNTPQISGMERAQVSAKKNLRWMCNKGVVDFPDTHPYAHNPKCWLRRGNRLYRGSSPIDYYLLKDKKKYYGVKKDYVAARNYLEKAFEAGQTKAAANLAIIYYKGLAGPKDMEKFDFYVNIASEVGHAKSSYYLAERAFKNGNYKHYIDKLNSASQRGHVKALSKLAWEYFNGEHLNRNHDSAFTYFFLAGKTEFVRKRDVRHGDFRLPFFKNRFLPTFKTDISLKLLKNSHKKAQDFAKENKFKPYQIKKIDRSYNIAVSDFNYVQETGGEWYKSNISSRILYYLMFFFLIMILRSIAETIIRKS